MPETPGYKFQMVVSFPHISDLKFDPLTLLFCLTGGWCDCKDEVVQSRGRFPDKFLCNVEKQ